MADNPSMFFAENPTPTINSAAATTNAFRMADAIGQAKDDIRVQHDTANDDAVLKAAMADPDNDWTHPEGFEKTVQSLQGKVSPDTYIKLQKRSDEIKTNAVKWQKDLLELPEQTLVAHEKIANYVTSSEEGVVNAYEAAKKAKEEDPNAPDPIGVFNTARTAKLAELTQVKNPLTGKPIVGPELVQKVANMSPDEFIRSFKESQYHQAQVTQAVNTRKEMATAIRDEKQAEYYGKKADAVGTELTRGTDPVARVIEEKNNGLFTDPDTGEFDQQAYEDAMTKAKSTGHGGSGGSADPLAHAEMKSLKLDGVPTELSYKDGKYYDTQGNLVDASKHSIEPLEKGTLSAVQVATVDTDIYETRRFIERARKMSTDAHAGPFFMDHNSPGAASRFVKNALTTEEQQLYDVYANRVAGAIVGMQSVGRFRGSNLSLDEAKKLVPVPGDTTNTIKAKIDYIEDFAKNTDRELTELKPGRKPHWGEEQNPDSPERAGSDEAPKYKPYHGFATPDDVGAALKENQLSREEAAFILGKMGVPSKAASNGAP